MTFDEAKAVFSRVDPDSKDPIVRGMISAFCGQAEALVAHWHVGGADKAAPPIPAVKGCFITQEIANRLDWIEAGVAANNDLIRAHMGPRREDYETTQAGLCEILARLDCPKTVKTVKRWEAYLSTGGEKGTKPPDGYSLQTRLTLESATAWARFYAAHEKAKLNVKTSLERLTGGRR